MESFNSIATFHDTLRADKFKKLLQSELIQPIWVRLDKTLSTLQKLENIVGKLDDKALLEQFENISLNLDKYKSTLNPDELNNIRKITDELLSLIYEKLDYSLTDYANKSSSLMVKQKELESIATQCKKTLDQTTKEAAEIKSKYQENFDDFIARSKDATHEYKIYVESDKEDFKKRSDSYLADMFSFFDQTKSDWNNAIENLDNQNSEYSKGIDELHSKLRIATYGIQSSAYLDASVGEQRFANILRIIALSLMVVVASLVAAMTFLSPQDQGVYGIAVRFILVFSLMIPAGYASKESGKHRERSEYYRLRGMEILALENYVSDMPKEEALGIKKMLVDKYFGITKQSVNGQEASGTPELLDLVSKLSGALKATPAGP